MKNFVAAFFVGFIGVLGCSAAKAPVVVSPSAPHADAEPLVLSFKVFVAGKEVAGEAKAPVGNQVKLVVEGKPDKTKWLTTLPEGSYEIFESGADLRFVFSTPVAGKYTIVLAGRKGERELDLVAQVVEVIGGSGPTPPEPHPPTPIDPPVDPKPPTPSKLANLVQGWVAEVKSPNRTEEVKRLAVIYETLPTYVPDGQKLVDALREATDQHLGASAPLWADFREKVRQEVNKQKLTSFAEVCKEIAAGLRASLGAQTAHVYGGKK